MTTVHTDLLATFSQPELRWLLNKMRKRMEAGKPLSGTVSLRAPSDPQRLAAQKLTGKLLVGDQINIQLAEVAQFVDRAHGVTLAQIVASILGDVEERSSLRDVRNRWRKLAESHYGDAIRNAWLDELQTEGLLRRLSGGDLERAQHLLHVALVIIGRLPALGLPLTELAADVVGDSHALDNGAPLHTLLIRYLAKKSGAESWTTTEARRQLWAEVGILCDELSAPVLVLNLSGIPGSHTADALNLHALAGEPYRLSIRQLLRNPPQFQSGRNSKIFVCENPTVVSAAANSLGAKSAPLLCVEGQPKTAAILLLRALQMSGFAVHYHGDFDWGGIRIGNFLFQKFGFQPWRYSSVEYTAHEKGKRLVGAPVQALWDGELTPLMQSKKLAVHEEAVLSSLLNDLA